VSSLARWGFFYVCFLTAVINEETGNLTLVLLLSSSILLCVTFVWLITTVASRAMASCGLAHGVSVRL
jgi:hypothetical protein